MAALLTVLPAVSPLMPGLRRPGRAPGSRVSARVAAPFARASRQSEVANEVREVLRASQGEALSMTAQEIYAALLRAGQPRGLASVRRALARLEADGEASRAGEGKASVRERDRWVLCGG